MRAMLLLSLLTIPFAARPARAASPWPAEAHTAAVKLTPIDAGLNAVNWSGAFWNPDTRTLWLACNSGYFWALVENGAGSFRVATNAAGTAAKWSPGGDLESICQADLAERVAYLMDENGWIREYDVSQYGVVRHNRSWDVRAQCPEVGGSGPEGLTFVPDAWLQRAGFRNAAGALCSSTNGMGGLMFVGHQNGGRVYVFDLNRATGGLGYVGRYLTGRSETAGLEFDRSTGVLYIWHNTGSNYLELTDLASSVSGAERRLHPLIEYVGPRTGNLEGFALLPAPETNNWCFITDDDNWSGEALVWYRQFKPMHLSVEAASASTHAVVLSWSSVPGLTYDICGDDTLAGGVTQVVRAGITATGSLNVATVDVSSAASGFYRVRTQTP